MADDMKIMDYLAAGLKAEAARQKAITNNIANINTPGYRRLDIQFEDVLTKAIQANEKLGPEDMEVEFYRPKTTAVKGNGNDVTLDGEVGQMVKNSLRHKTYMLLLKKKYRQLTDATKF